ncbi:MAG: hypothetical protein QM808_15320 [Steroidobacteraceae bacterium]
MQGLILSLLVSAAVAPAHPSAPVATPVRAIQAAPAAGEWSFSGQADQSCELQFDGAVTDATGASLELQCAEQSQVLGNVQARIAAQGWRQRRVTLSAEIRVSEAMNASLWLKTQRQNTTLMFDDDTEQNLLDTTSEDGWVQRVITLPVAADATQISFGALLQGGGALQLRNVQVSVSDAGSIAPQAAQFLDAVINIVKQQTAQRDDLAWQVLEPQLRLFASGAQSTADVYPAIKYLLSRLGDKQSLLLTPEVAVALSQGRSAAAADVQIFALPDGARLVLSRAVAKSAVRTAQNLGRIEALP